MLRSNVRAPVAWLTLDRPEKLNAMTRAFFGELRGGARRAAPTTASGACGDPRRRALLLGRRRHRGRSASWRATADRRAYVARGDGGVPGGRGVPQADDRGRARLRARRRLRADDRLRHRRRRRDGAVRHCPRRRSGSCPGLGVVRGGAHVNLHTAQVHDPHRRAARRRARRGSAGLVNDGRRRRASTSPRPSGWPALDRRALAARGRGREEHSSPPAPASATRTRSTRWRCCRGARISPRASRRSRERRAAGVQRPMSDRSGDGAAPALAELERRREAALAMGGAERIERHHASGRLTARERIDAAGRRGLLVRARAARRAGAAPRRSRRPPTRSSPGSARVDGRKVCVIAVDATVLAGTTAPVNMRKQNRIARWAGGRGLPLDLPQRQRRRPHPGRDGLALLGAAVRLPARSCRRPRAGPEIPRLIAVLGASFGDSALHASMGHYVVMTQDAAIALSGPPVVAAAIGEELTAEELGGPKLVRRARAATPTRVVDDEEAAIDALKRALSLPAGLAAHPGAGARRPPSPARDAGDLLELVPSRPAARLRHAQGARGDLRRRQHPAVGRALRRAACSARSRASRGRPVGVVASQPMQRAGVLDVPALAKEAAFVDLCDTFNLPLVFLQDVPGLMIGSEAERRGILAGLRERRRAARAGDACRRSRWSCARPTAAATSRSAVARRTPTSCSPGRPPSSGFMAPDDRRPDRLQAPARGGAAPARARRPHDALVDGARRGVGARVGAVGGRRARLPRRRDRPAPDARGGRRPGSSFAWGSGPRHRRRPIGRIARARRAARAHLPSRPRSRPGDRRLEGDPRRARPRASSQSHSSSTTGRRART